MSIVVAARKGREIVLAADGQTSFGSQRVASDNHRAAKILRLGGALVATTGWSLYANILDDLAAGGKVPALGSQRAIFAFFQKFWKLLHDRYPFVKDQAEKDDDSPFGDMGATFLVAGAGGLFHVACDTSVTRFEKFYAIGSGADYALGALHVLYDEIDDADALARRAVAAAIQFDLYCGGEIAVERARARK
jgi:ATP-dependent HslUV protease subunit HslV